MITQIASPSTFQRFPTDSTKNGDNNIRFQRPGNYTYLENPAAARALLNSQATAPKNEWLYDPYIVKLDYLRVEIFLPEVENFESLLEEDPERYFDFETNMFKFDKAEKALQQLVEYLFPSKSGVGFSETVAPLSYSFKLVPGIKEYSMGYKDAQTGGLIGYEPALKDPKTGTLVPYQSKLKDEYERYLDDEFVDSLEEEFAKESLDNENSDGHIIGYRSLVQLGGEYFRSLKPIEVLRLLDYLEGLGCKCQRIDLAVDVPQSLGVLKGAIQASENDHFTNLRSSTYMRSGARGEKKSETVYFGSRESQFFARIYDTEVKHGYKADRFEGEFKRDKACQVFKAIAGLEFYQDSNDKLTRLSNLEIMRNAQKLLANHLVGQFDFYDEIKRRPNQSIENIKLSCWWEDFKDKILAHAPVRVIVKCPEKSISKTLRWLYRQVSGVLAIFSEALGIRVVRLIKSLIAWGKKRFTLEDEATVAFLKGGAMANLGY